MHFGKPEDLCYVGIDVSQDVAGSIWDNILVTDDFEYAQKMMEETFFAIQEGERVAYARAQQNKEKMEKSEHGLSVNTEKSESMPNEL